MTSLLVLLSLTAADAKPQNARQVAESYVGSALAGKPEDAAMLGAEGKSPARKESAEKLKEIVGKDKLPVTTVIASDAKGYALAVTGPFKVTDPKPGRPDAGCLVLTLTKTKDGWRVKDIDFRTEEEAKKQVEAVPDLYPDAQAIPAAKAG